MIAIAKRFSKPPIGFATFIAGIASLFLPHFSGWIDIVFPSIAYYILLLYLLWKTFFAITLFLSLSHVLALFLLNISACTKWIAISMSAGLIILFLGIYPNFATEEYLGSEQRVSFFAVGGQTRIVLAGGSEIIKNDALALLSKKTDDEGFVHQELWAGSLKKLGVYSLQVDKESKSVIAYIPQTRLFDADQFGYLISSDGISLSSVLTSKYYRLWKLAEGLYFFQSW